MSLLSCCFPISHEAQMLKACYPPAKQLPATSAPLSADDSSYKPLSQELSRLTYYASNKPGKLNRLAGELEERVGKEARKAKAGYGKHRIYLLISLSIARALVTECRTDLSLFSRSIIRIIDTGLDAAVAPYNPSGTSASSSASPSGPLAARNVDLEVALRAGALFAAWETYADVQVLAAAADAGGAAGVSGGAGVYISVLRKLARIAGANGVRHGSVRGQNGQNGGVNEKDAEKDDDETRNRTRLAALAALSSAVQSETTFATGAEFEQIIRILVPALLDNIWLGTMEEISLETAKAEIDASPSPFFLEFSTRPPLRERRAPSLHAHVAGEKGPFTSDVIGAAVRTLRRLLAQSHVSQISTIVLAMFVWLDSHKGWCDAEKCKWLSESATAFTMLQYRYAVPATMLEVLAAEGDVPAPDAKHTTLLSMLNGVLAQSKSSLVGLSTTEILGVIVNLITRRCRISPDDALLPHLVGAVDALSAHVYYADQANDLVEDLAGRIARVQAAGPTSATESKGDQAEELTRQATLRVLVSCLASLILAPQPRPTGRGEHVDPHAAEHSVAKNPSPEEVSPASFKRNPVSPEVWQETLPLLCESTFALRAEYAKALALYLEQELPAYTRSEVPDQVERGPMFEDPTKEGVQRFMHALFATLYTLAVSSNLGYAGPALPVQSPTAEERDETTDLADATRPSFRLRQATGDTPTVESPAESSLSLARKTSNTSRDQPPRIGGRRMSKLVSLPLNRLEGSSQMLRSEGLPNSHQDTEQTAGPGDYAIFCHVFDLAARAVPDVATLDGFPMLVALDRDAAVLVKRANRATDVQSRIAACREAARYVSTEIVSLWQADSPSRSQQRAFPAAFSYHLSRAAPGLQAPEQPAIFAIPAATQHAHAAIDVPASIRTLSHSSALARSSGLQDADITQRLLTPWSTTTALQNSIEQYEAKKRDTRDRLATEEADRLRTISTQSSRSFLQNAPRPVDISDLRDALGGGQASLAPKSAAPTVSTVQTRNRADTLENGSTNGTPALRSLTQGDVNDILKDIVRDKSRHRKSASGATAAVTSA